MFDYTSNINMGEKTKQNKTNPENTTRNFLLFTCTSGKWVQGKRGSTLVIHTVFAGVMGQQVEAKNIQGVLGHRSSSVRGLPRQGPASVLQTRSKVQTRAKGGSARTAGTHGEPQLLTSHLRLVCLRPHGSAPRVIRATSPTPARPAAGFA